MELVDNYRRPRRPATRLVGLATSAAFLFGATVLAVEAA
jgi:hypothetical protein